MARKIKLEWDFTNKQLDDTIDKWKVLNKELLDAASNFDKINQEAKKGAGLLDVQNLKDLDSEFDKINKNIGNLDKNLKKTTTDLGSFSNAAKAATQNINQMNTASAKASQSKPFTNFAQGADAMKSKLGGLSEAFSAFSGAAKGSFAGVGQMAGNLGAVAGPWGAVAGAAITAGVAAADFASTLIQEVKPQLQETRNVFNELTGDQIDRMAAQVQALTNKMGGDFSENLKTTQELMYTFGISAGQADEIMQNLLLNLTPKQAGEAMEWVREYDTQFRSLGFSAEETANVIVNSMDMGVWQDKALDAIKEFGLRINDIPDSAQRALRDAKLWTIYEQMRNGTISAKDGVKQLTEKLREMKAQGKDITPLTTAIFGAPGEDMAAGIGYLDEMINKTKELSVEEQKRQRELKDQKEAEEAAMVARNRLISSFLEMFGGSISSIEQLISKIKEGFFTFLGYILEAVKVVTSMWHALYEVWTVWWKLYTDTVNYLARLVGIYNLTGRIKDKISEWVYAVEYFGRVSFEIFKELGKMAQILSDGIRMIFTSGFEAAGNYIKKNLQNTIVDALHRVQARMHLDKFKDLLIGSGEVNGANGSSNANTIKAPYKPSTDFADEQKIAQKRLELLKQNQVSELELEKQRKLQSMEVRGDKAAELKVEEEFLNKKYNIEKEFNESIRALQLNQEKKEKVSKLKQQQSDLDFQKQQQQAQANHQKELEAIQFKYRDELLNDEKMSNEERFNALNEYYNNHFEKLKINNKNEIQVEISKIETLIQLEKARFLAFAQIQGLSNQQIEEEQKKHDDAIKKLTNDLTNAQIKAETDKTIRYENARIHRKQLIEQEKKDFINTAADISDLSKGLANGLVGLMDMRNRVKELNASRDAFLEAGDEAGAAFMEGVIRKTKQQAVLGAASNVLNGIKDTFQTINNIRLAQEDAIIAKNNKEIEQLREIVNQQQEQNKVLDERQKIDNKLAENRIKELETLSETIPESERERAKKLIQIEKDKIKQSLEIKKKEQTAEEKRIKDLEKANKEAEERKRKTQRENFEIQRAAQIIQIVIATAQAAINAFSSLAGIPVVGPALGAAAAAVAGGFGAAQIALVAAQPNPYHHGTLNVEGGVAGKDSVHALLEPGEAVIPVDRNRAYGDSVDAIFNRKVPASVLNDFVKAYKKKNVTSAGGGATIIVNPDGTKEIVDAIRDKPVVSINIDDDGFGKFIEKNNETTRIRNKKLRIDL